MAYLGIMDKGSTLAIWRQVARCGIFETFYYSLLFIRNCVLMEISRPLLTVLPDPFEPTIKVNGAKNWMVSLLVLSNERTL